MQIIYTQLYGFKYSYKILRLYSCIGSIKYFHSGRIDIAIWMHSMESHKTAGEEARRQLHKNAASNLEQVMAATPTRHQLYGHLPPITKTIQVRRTRHVGLLEKQGRAHKWCNLMDPHTWPCKSRMTSTNIHSATMWGDGMLSRRPARCDEQ